jgi:hypothetical protein
MPFTVAELENIANAAIDFHTKRGKVLSQSIQEKPLLNFLSGKEESFPGGKELLTGGVKGVYTTTVQGFSADDPVTYSNPTNIKRYSYSYKLLHAGIQFTMDEMARDGISINDTTTGKGESEHTDREMTMLANLLKDKIEDMDEGTDRAMNTMYWRDGTQDAKEIPGIRSFILDDPTSATVVGGIDQSLNTWWRNRASLLIASSDPTLLGVTNKLQTEVRQLRRYGGRPTKGLCGSSWLEFLEKELRSKGTFVQEGWAKAGKIDMSTSDIVFKGIEMEYDPTLDDLGLAKYCYLLDPKHIFPKFVEGEKWKKHNPARPENKYVFYRAQTYMGGLVCDQRNANGVYSIA